MKKISLFARWKIVVIKHETNRNDSITFAKIMTNPKYDSEEQRYRNKLHETMRYLEKLRENKK